MTRHNLHSLSTMFSGYSTTRDEMTLSQWYHAAYLNNIRASVQPTGEEEATQVSYYTTGSNLGSLVDPNYQTISPPAVGPQQLATAESNWARMEYPSDHAILQGAMPEPELSQSFPLQRPELPTENLPPMSPTIYNIGDPNSSGASLQQWARITANRIANDPAFQEEMLRGLKRPRTPEPDLGAGPSQWMANSEDRDVADPQPRRTKRIKITIEEGETGDRVAAQRGETQEPRVRRTPTSVKNKSKLGSQGLRSETHVVPSQGVYHPLSPGPTITEATPGPTELGDQAWTEGGQRISEGMEDAHDEEETDKQRWARLMYREEGRWRCRGCDGKPFSDRSTLQRHCRSSAHAKQRDLRQCPLCPKVYKRLSGLNRHFKEKHR